VRGTFLIERGAVEPDEIATLAASERDSRDEQFLMDKYSDWSESWGQMWFGGFTPARSASAGASSSRARDHSAANELCSAATVEKGCQQCALSDLECASRTFDFSREVTPDKLASQAHPYRRGTFRPVGSGAGPSASFVLAVSTRT
jgi:hypothetical protein